MECDGIIEVEEEFLGYTLRDDDGILGLEFLECGIFLSLDEGEVDVFLSGWDIKGLDIEGMILEFSGSESVGIDVLDLRDFFEVLSEGLRHEEVIAFEVIGAGDDGEVGIIDGLEPLVNGVVVAIDES